MLTAKNYLDGTRLISPVDGPWFNLNCPNMVLLSDLARSAIAGSRKYVRGSFSFKDKISRFK
jgi:hypothetical protein